MKNLNFQVAPEVAEVSPLKKLSKRHSNLETNIRNLKKVWKKIDGTTAAFRKKTVSYYFDKSAKSSVKGS